MALLGLQLPWKMKVMCFMVRNGSETLGGGVYYYEHFATSLCFITPDKQNNFCTIWESHGGGHEELYILAYNAV